MSSIRGKDTKPEVALRRGLWATGVRGWRCHWKGPGGRIDIAFTRWCVAVFVDGSFWHGHPSKWQTGRWKGYWEEKIRRNIARDRAQEEALREAGWYVVRVWDFEIEQDLVTVVAHIREALEDARRHRS
jgi:DNA mismatch endonuclease (patch repair protein)